MTKVEENVIEEPFEEENTYTLNFTFQKKINYEITLRIEPSSDIDVFKQIIKDQDYKPLVDLIMKDNNVPGTLNILDAGGNIGLASVYFHCYFPGSRFIIVEPDENNFKIQQKNIQKNNILNTNLVYGGVWNKDTYLKTVRDYGDHKDWAVRVVETAEPTELEGFSIITLMKKFNFDYLDILKIDIEGSEKILFAEPIAASLFLSKTKYIAIEIHDQFECRDDIYKCLKENNFEFFDDGQLTIGKNNVLV